MSPADRIVVGVLGLLITGLWLWVWVPDGVANAAVVTGPEGSITVPLNTPTTFTVDGPLGATTLEVSDGRIRFVASPCPHKICIRSGWHARAGSVAACVPNRISLRLIGGPDSGLDGMSQ